MRVRFPSPAPCEVCSGLGIRWRLVEEEPERAHGAHRFGKFAERDELADVTVGTEVVGAAEVFFFGGSEDDDGNYPGPLVGADAAEDFERAHLGQFKVEQDERRAVLAALLVPRSIVRASPPLLATATG